MVILVTSSPRLYHSLCVRPRHIELCDSITFGAKQHAQQMEDSEVGERISDKRQLKK